MSVFLNRMYWDHDSVFLICYIKNLFAKMTCIFVYILKERNNPDMLVLFFNFQRKYKSKGVWH